MRWRAGNTERGREASHGVYTRPLQGSYGWRHPLVRANRVTGNVGNGIVGSSVTIRGDLWVVHLDWWDGLVVVGTGGGE